MIYHFICKGDNIRYTYDSSTEMITWNTESNRLSQERETFYNFLDIGFYTLVAKNLCAECDIEDFFAQTDYLCPKCRSILKN